jgi:two-component system response regulator RegX3
MDALKILVVDDEPALVEMLSEWLVKGGYEVIPARDGLTGLRAFFKHQPDLVILDVAMPAMTGFELCQRIREVSPIPIIMLTAKAQELDKVRGLTQGADDYLVKPIGRQELLARIGALLRRSYMSLTEPLSNYDDSVISLDFAKHEAVARGEKVLLTPTEYRLLTCLVQSHDRVLTLQQISDRTWAGSSGSPDIVKWHVASLRKKIEINAEKPELILTVRGVGYLYQKPLANPVVSADVPGLP